MGSGKRKEKLRPLVRKAPGDQAKERHLRDRNGILHDWSAPLPKGLVAQPAVRRVKSKHHSYFEFVENKDKKKKLEFQITTEKTPPPGYEFVPIGKPELTTACKELSREKDAMIFIVSDITSGIAPELSLALNRLGHHIRESIVAEARASLGEVDATQSASNAVHNDGLEPIPESQEEINEQADAAIRDLFPRIPHIDRQQIIERSFRKGAMMGGKPLVGLNPEISLSRRVQLAVIAHIRHEHTRYDQLLRETTYANARKAVVPLCLDYLVKWRGDEETGRDQLDEILREVVVISDTEDEEEDDEEEDDADEDTEDTDATSAETSDNEAHRSPEAVMAMSPVAEQDPSASTSYIRDHRHAMEARAAGQSTKRKQARDQRRARKKRAKGTNMGQRGFQRYQAVRNQAWQQALDRQRRGLDEVTPRAHPVRMAVSRDAGRVPQYIGSEAPEPYHLASIDHGAMHPNDSGNGAVYVGRPPSRVLPARVDDGLSSLGFAVSRPASQQHYSEAPLREPQTSNASERIDGPRYRAFGSSSDFHTVVSRPGQDLKDYLVPSIEPASPATQPGQWQPRSDGHYADHVRNAPPHDFDEVPIFVRHLPAHSRNAFPRPPPPVYGHASDPGADFVGSHPRRPGMHGPVSRYAVDGSGGQHRQIPFASTSRYHYMADEPLDEQYVPRFGNHIRTERRPITREHRLQDRDADVLRGPSRPFVIDDHELVECRGLPRPIVIDDAPTALEHDHNRHPPIDRGQDSEIIVVRRAAPSNAAVYDDNLVADQADLYPVRNGVRNVPMDPVRVSHNISHPHGVAPRRHEGWEAFDRRPRIEYRQEPEMHRRDVYRVPVQQPPEARAHLPRQERVVRLEYVDYESPDNGRGRSLFEGERVYQPPNLAPAPAQPPSGAAYQALHDPVYRRHPRQESVIYIE